MNARFDSVRELPIAEALTPAELDDVLRQRILKYTSRRSYSYSKLAERLAEFVREQYATAPGVDDTDAAVEHHLSMHCPKRSFLNQYAKGGAMCFRYINTVANFFDVQYTLSNFNPAADMQRQYELKERRRNGEVK